VLAVPAFESSLLVSDDPVLAAKVSALFVRPRRYLVVMDGPRMTRSDASNEVMRRRNAMVMANPRMVLTGGMPQESVEAIRKGWQSCTVSDLYEDHVAALRGLVARPKGRFHWGSENLGVGLYQARLLHQELVVDLDTSPSVDIVRAGTHLLVACERGEAMSEIAASNLAFSCGASFAVFPELGDDDRDRWVEELYALGEGGDVTGAFADLAYRARTHLGATDFSQYKVVLFVTSGFPWGIAVPEVPTTHMYNYPDFGRAVVEGLWASRSADRGSRTALLIDPGTVDGSEMPAIQRALMKNGTVTRVVRGRSATISQVQFLSELLPHDIVVLSSHAGDAGGERITYEYPDAEGRTRRLVVDRALGFGYDRVDDKVLVMEHFRFHALDGVDWRDKAGKAALPVGSAINVWSELGGPIDRKAYIVAEERLDRVIGSMAIQLHDGVWLFNPQGFAPGSAPLFINNSCWSWHELSQRTTFAGARGYVGSLFPVTNAEAQSFGEALFSRHIQCELPRALWLAQAGVYGVNGRRPYVMVGLPFVAIRPNVTSALPHIEQSYLDGIDHWTKVTRHSSSQGLRRNADRFARFLFEDFLRFKKAFQDPEDREIRHGPVAEPSSMNRSN
jgi:hypothetical protein